MSINEDMEVLRERVMAELMTPVIDEKHIEHLMNTIREDGSWPDITMKILPGS